MRNKLKQLLKKEGGFTLIELLAVIAILAIIVAISIPLIGNVVEGAKKNTAESQEALVIDAAQLYYLQEDKAAAENVSTDDLKTAGYLEKNYKGPKLTITKQEAEDGILAANEKP